MKQPLDRDEVELYMNAKPNEVYALIADVTRMAEFSPEILDVRWLDGATEASVGARFVARNKVSRGPSWRNKPVITVVDPGKKISWARTEPFGGTVEWTYRFEPEAGGTRVIESYEVTKPIGHIGWFIIGTLAGQKGRRSIMRRGMEQTLERIRSTVEANR